MPKNQQLEIDPCVQIAVICFLYEADVYMNNVPYLYLGNRYGGMNFVEQMYKKTYSKR